MMVHEVSILQILSSLQNNSYDMLELRHHIYIALAYT
jgi:hypothetical protein